MIGRRLRVRPRRTLAAVFLTMLLSACGDGAVDPDLDGGTYSVVVWGGGDQKGLAEEILPLPVRVRVVDAGGRGVAGERVRFDVVAGAGDVLSPTAVTDGAGVAVTRWRLGPAEVPTQRLRASLEGASGGAGVSVEATAVGMDQADRVVVHGALGPLKGIVLIREAGPGIEIVQEKPASDTVVVLQPQDAAGVDVVVFAPSNRPLRATPTWTPGPDTVHLTLQPPVSVDIRFTVKAGAFEERSQVIAGQLANMERVWTDAGMGLLLGDIAYVDATGSGQDTQIVSQGLCSGRTPGSAIEVTYVSTIDGGNYDGWGCWSGYVFMSLRSGNYPYLLAHELGHTFTLEHTADGLMYPSNPGTLVRDGEVFRAHFHRSSALNTIFDAQPDALRRTCLYLQTTSPCLPDDYRLGAGVISLVASRAALHDGTRPRGRPLDGVEEQLVRPPRLPPELRPEPEQDHVP